MSIFLLQNLFNELLCKLSLKFVREKGLKVAFSVIISVKTALVGLFTLTFVKIRSGTVPKALEIVISSIVTPVCAKLAIDNQFGEKNELLEGLFKGPKCGLTKTSFRKCVLLVFRAEISFPESNSCLNDSNAIMG